MKTDAKATLRKGRKATSKQQVVSEFRRAEIIAAARTVFARRGFDGGIIDEIAREARIAKGTVYLYFRSKAEIYKAVIDHDMKILKQSTLDRIAAAGTLREKIEAFTLARLENAETRKELLSIMDSARENLSFSRSEYRNWLQEPVLRLTSAITDAIARGEIRPVPAEQAAWSIADMTRGAVQRRLLGNSGSSLQKDSEFIASFVWSALQFQGVSPHRPSKDSEKMME